MVKQCPSCNLPFEPKSLELLGARIFESKFCEKCSEILAAEFDREQRDKERAEFERRNRERWERICPPLYRDTDVARLPQGEFTTLMAWQYGPRGAIVTGKTGTGKTRMMFQLLRRLFDEHRALRVYTATTFRAAVQAAQMDNRFEAWLEAASTVDVFYFDDLGQMKLTESSEEALLALVEARVANCKPIFVTTQYGGEEFVAQFIREQRGSAVLRRLKEFCEII